MELRPQPSINPRVLLSWTRKHAALYSLLSRNIIREVSTYFQRFPTLLWINEDHMLLFDLGLMRILPAIRFKNRIHNAAIQKNQSSRWVLVDSNRVAICGGGGEVTAGLNGYAVGSVWNSAYMLYTTRSEGQVLPSMLSGHCDHGIVAWKGAILVFGSSSPQECRKCERLDLKASKWTSLPLMNRARWDFTPAVWQEAVFLCGGHTYAIEVYNGFTMSLLQVNLPQKGKALVCTKGDNLLILSSKNLTTLTKTRSLFIEEHKRIQFNARTSPVCFGNVIYQFCDKQLRMFSATRGEE